MKIIISGALGRMGKELAEAAKNVGVEVVCGVDSAVQSQTAGFPLLSSYDLVAQQADVLIDFSVAGNLETILQYALREKLALVLCVTGYTAEQLHRITEASVAIPILQSANMSFGVQVLARLAAMATRALGDDFDIEIVEKHHNKKIDSPSGTALLLLDTLQNERAGLNPLYGRHGKMGERQKNEIGVHAIRGGTVAGEHEVGFYGNAEEIILTHRAESRALFARGALRAAKFLCDKPPGLYAMKDVVSEIF